MNVLAIWWRRESPPAALLRWVAGRVYVAVSSSPPEHPDEATINVPPPMRVVIGRVDGPAE